ncbi:MAG: SRPBCC family protein [Acidobacteria bacterium]|nr:SRPBCC family protein [Acidobacteriota bacterium]
MIVTVSVAIQGTADAVWSAITDLQHAAQFMSGIEQIEMLEQPPSGWVGLRWNETRILFDKPATVEKWITQATENVSYQTQAESNGFIFVTTKKIEAGENGVILSESHESKPQSLLAYLQAIMMGLFFRGVLKKAILQDLNDIKAAVEKS